MPKDSEVLVGAHEDQLVVSRGALTPANIKKALDITDSSIPNRILRGPNLMVAASRALVHTKAVMERKEYATFNLVDFSLLGTFTKEERIQTKQVFNYIS